MPQGPRPFLQRSPQMESTALGAAALASLGVGLWPSAAEAVARLQAGGQVFEPRRDQAWRTSALGRWRRAVRVVLNHARDDGSS